ncbi:NAD-dependent epimerase/dehydratase family protein [Flexithrix dorotheae]|uniref:NAD-dependent epimerase/dehydratase family protein n=1 Tax=Flexithrix dorotheae TaxID=70993 RepID=UPI00036EE473|nr:NAD-dependent epimerase/dehydratase family protein [Flexithrix dorotheae]
MKDQRENEILVEDMAYILGKLSKEEKAKFNNSTVLITGCGGFLGYYFMHFFSRYADELNIKKIIALENFLTGTKDWLDDLVNKNDKITLHEFNVITDDISDVDGADEADLIIHGASIASPTFYRIYPVETIDANITGLRRLLDFYKERDIKGLLFFSSSEIYGDPFPEFIPTDEEYRGNVHTMGPRACYDEAKRFGETMCYIFHHKFNMPISIARPFNNYGPGMNIEDKRLPADFAKCVHEGRDLIMFSDGKPTRTFCYISDAITGYLKVMLYGKLEAFNIGIDKPEVSVKEFANLFVKNAQEVYGYKGKAQFQESDDAEYMTDNPNRRCPKIDKAKSMLNYEPSIYVEEGIGRFLKFLKINNGKLI